MLWSPFACPMQAAGGLDNPDTAREQLTEYKTTLEASATKLWEPSGARAKNSKSSSSPRAMRSTARLGRNGEILAEGKDGEACFKILKGVPKQTA